MIEFSSSWQENEIHMVDGPFNEGSKNIIFSREGRPENLGKLGNGRDIYFYANRGVVNFEREHQSLRPGSKIIVMPQVSYMSDHIVGKKIKKLNFQAKIWPSQNIRTYPKIFHMAKCLMF